MDRTGYRSNWQRPGARNGWGLVFLLLLVALGTPPVDGAGLTASLDREMITLGERAQLSLTFTGDGPQEPPQIPAVPELQITYAGPSTQVSIVNGQMSRTVTHLFTVAARQTGDFTIPAVTARVGNQTLSSLPLRLKVLKPGAPPPEAITSGSQLAFMKLVVPKKELFVGEMLVLELQLFFNGRLSNRGAPELTSFPAEGLSLGKFTESQGRQVQIGNAVYSMVPVAVPVRATRPGPITVGPVTANVVVELPSGRRSQSIFDQFLGGGGERRQVTMATEEITLQALALPTAGVPAGFNGAVGRFTLAVNAGPTNIAVGDPITVKVEIAGRGMLEALALPEQDWKGFKAYPPTSKVDTTDPLGLQGVKSFEQVVVPENTDIQQLPPVRFSYFDPDLKAYKTLTNPGPALVVKPVGAVAAPTIVGSRRSDSENPPPAQDIVHIKPRMGTLARIDVPLFRQPGFLAVQALPILAWVSVLIWRKRADSLANNPRLRRQKQVARLVRARLEDLRTHAANNRSDEFFATVAEVLREQIGERLDLPASAITEAVIDEHLRPRGAGDEITRLLDELFQACNQARYAPVKSSQELAAYVPKVERALQQLQGLKA